MGRKGVSKRKPKQSNNIKSSSNNARPGASLSVQNLVKGGEDPLNSGSTNSHTGSNKKNKKGR